MADGSTVEYIITIKGDGAGGKSGNNASGTSKKSGVATSTTGESAGGFQGIKPTAIAKAAAIYAIDKSFTTYISRVGITTGQTAFQERLNFQYGVAKRIAVTGGALAMGISSGNVLVAGAAIVSFAKSGIDLAITQGNINLERRVEEIGIRQANIRAGAGGDRSGKSNY